jgi:hypothetical protein
VGISETKPRYTIRNLSDGKEYVVDVSHLRPFYYDPNFVTPLNIAAKDASESVVEKIVTHDFSDPLDKKWLVRWAGDSQPDETWERYDNLKNVEVFQHYCARFHMDPFPPKQAPRFSASMPNMLRFAGGPFTVPVPPMDAVTTLPNDATTVVTPQTRRGRPRKHH